MNKTSQFGNLLYSKVRKNLIMNYLENSHLFTVEVQSNHIVLALLNTSKL